MDNRPQHLPKSLLRFIIKVNINRSTQFDKNEVNLIYRKDLKSMKEESPNELLYAKLDDKIRFCNSKNKITHTDFFTEPEIIKIEKYLKLFHFWWL